MNEKKGAAGQQASTAMEESMTKSNVNIGNALKMLLGLIWRLDKKYYLVLISLSLTKAANTILNLFIPKILIDGFRKSWQWETFVLAITILVIAKYSLLQLQALANRQHSIHQSILDVKFPMEFAKKVMAIDYANLEDAKVLDLKERALFPLVNYSFLFFFFFLCLYLPFFQCLF